MTNLLNIDNDLAKKENCTLEEQIKEIATSELFLGCHSAPQMVACAFTDTPVICINYMAQETTKIMDDNIAKLSYEPTGKQVKAILYNKCFDKDDKEIVPTQNNPAKARSEAPSNEDIMKSTKEVLG